MMMGGFGALMAMNDTNKLNRDMLKSGKHQPFQKEFRKKADGSLTLNDKPVDENAIKLIRASTLEERNRKTRVSIFVLIFLCVLFGRIAGLILSA